MSRATSTTTRPGRPVAAEPGSDTEERKLHRLGSVSVGIALPRQWVARRGLTSGAAVFVSTRPDGTILVRDGRDLPALATAQLHVPTGGAPEHLFRQLLRAYLSGAQRFEVVEDGPLSSETRGAVLEFVRRTIRPEVVSDDGQRIVVADVSRGADLAVGPVLRRMAQVVLDRIRNAGRSWVDASPTPPSDWRARDDEVDRHAWLIERILVLRPWPDAGASGFPSALSETFAPLFLSRALERAADHAVLIAERGARLREANLPEATYRSLSAYHKQVADHLELACRVAEARDPTDANLVVDAGEALHETAAALRERFWSRGLSSPLPPSVVAGLGLLIESLDRITAYAQDVAQLAVPPSDRVTVRPALGADSRATDLPLPK
ncbi:MAG TPA: PhoU domain-containing protein [Thermoplasmata archaeon]|nr:PhoU domain-containing protein [Thermoplasmata archaeon]